MRTITAQALQQRDAGDDADNASRAPAALAVPSPPVGARPASSKVRRIARASKDVKVRKSKSDSGEANEIEGQGLCGRWLQDPVALVYLKSSIETCGDQPASIDTTHPSATTLVPNS